MLVHLLALHRPLRLGLPIKIRRSRGDETLILLWERECPHEPERTISYRQEIASSVRAILDLSSKKSRGRSLPPTLHAANSPLRSLNSQLQPPLIQINILKHRLHRPGRQSKFRQSLMQPLRHLIPPPALNHKRIPNLNVILRRLASVRERPFQQPLIRPAFQHLRFERRIIDPQKPAASPIERIRIHRPLQRRPIRRQLSLRSQSNLIHHPSKMNQTADLLSRPAQPGNNRRIRLLLHAGNQTNSLKNSQRCSAKVRVTRPTH